ncbi:MAG: envelope stress response membrane protein PspB [Xanthomonadales bacterium]|nr:envelope stress response membrane protein PspB [Xanthomonadales bacterium]
MGAVLEVWGILFLAVVAPLWIIFHYVSKAKENKGLTPEDERMLEDLWDSAKKMEDRIQTLERILDSDAPGWRRRA